MLFLILLVGFKRFRFKVNALSNSFPSVFHRFRFKVNALSNSFPSVFHIIDVVIEEIVIIHFFADSKELI